MEDKILKLEEELTISTIQKYIEYFEKEYNKVSIIRIYSINNGQKERQATFLNKEELKKSIDNKYLDKIDLIEIYFINTNSHPIKIKIDKIKKEIIIKEYRLNDNPMTNDNLNQEVESITFDTNYKYYKFDTGIVAKYDKKTGLYYTLDSQNNWKIDERVFPWIIGSEYDYEEINIEKEQKKQNNNKGK